jgi:uncharacterized membrane protein YgdD (TMEM256/DUF423 family)
MTLRRFGILVSSLLGGSGILGGAFGAHALAQVSPERANVLKTAAQYQLIHAVAILALSMWGVGLASKALRVALVCMSAGTFVFSMSLSLIAVLNYRWAGPITPFGGTLMIIGWASVAFYRPAEPQNHS